MKALYNRRHAGGDGERRSFAFFVVGGLAVLAAVFLIGLQVGRYVEKSAARDGQAAKPGQDNATDIGRDLGAYSEEAAKVRPVPPPDADNGVKETEKSVTFPETLARKEPGPVPLVRPEGGKTGVASAGKAAPRAKPFLLQSGVFRNKASAQAMKSRLSRAGYPAKLLESRGKKGVRYRVLVGPYAARESALKTKRKLKADMKIEAVLVKG